MKLFVFALFVAAAVAAPLEDDSVVDLIVNGVPEGQAVELGDIVDVKVKEHVDGEVVASTDLLHPLTAAGIAEAAAAAALEEVIPLPVQPEIVIPMPVVMPAPVQPEVVIPESVVMPAPVQPEVVIPESVVMPAPVQPEVVIPESVVMPGPVQPEVVFPESVVMPAPIQPEVVIPESVVMPAPVQPEVVVPESVVMPAPVQPEVVIPEAVVMPAPVRPEVVIPESVVMPAPVQPEVFIPAPVPSAHQIGEIFNDGTVQVNVNVPESSLISTIQGWFSMVMNYISDGDVKATQQII